VTADRWFSLRRPALRHINAFLDEDCLRRSALRNLERAGVPRQVAMKITGHKTESIYQRYDIVSPRDMKTAAE
jgi:hypothetical protein